MILEYFYQIEFYGDFDGSFHKSLNFGIDLSAALLARRSHRRFYFFNCSAVLKTATYN